MFDPVPMNELFLKEELSLYDKLKYVNYGAKVKYVLKPIEYAWEIHNDFLEKYCRSTKKILFLGMNPGPWGMMQNGIPFGESCSARDFLRVVGAVTAPSSFHPSRPVLGLSCTRSEVSGKRFWALASLLSAADPLKFFENSFVYNYFPFCLLDENGKNVTPPELKGLEVGVKEYIEKACDATLIDVLKLLRVEVIIAIGRYAQTKVGGLVKKSNLSVEVVYLPHPSPRNPASNRNWLDTAKHVIVENNLSQYFHI